MVYWMLLGKHVKNCMVTVTCSNKYNITRRLNWDSACLLFQLGIWIWRVLQQKRKLIKLEKNGHTEEQLLRRERSKGEERKQRKCRRPWNILIYLGITLFPCFSLQSKAVPCWWHTRPEPAMTPGQSKCWKSLAEGALKQRRVLLRKSRGDLQDTIIPNRDPCVQVQGILLCRHKQTYMHTYARRSPNGRNQISLSVVAIGRELDRGYYTSMHTTGLFKSMNMDRDDHNVWTWITHVCQNHTATGSACVLPTPWPSQRKKKKKRNQKWKNK